jgi:hypothetical protein
MGNLDLGDSCERSFPNNLDARSNTSDTCEDKFDSRKVGYGMDLASCRHAALIQRAFQYVSSEELQQLELILKKTKRAESLVERKSLLA